MICYITLVVFVFFKLGVWDLSQLKNTVIWFFTAAAVSSFRIVSISEEKEFFLIAIKDNFKFVMIIEFVVAFHTFSLLAELLVIPIVTFLVLMVEFSKGDKEHQIVERFFNGIVTTFGLFIVIYATYKTFSDLDKFFVLETFREFYLPPLLSLSFLPYIYLMALFVIYEKSFTRIRISIKDEDLRRYAKMQAITKFGFNTELLQRWAISLFVNRISDREDVKNTIDEIQEITKREENPKHVPLELGWSPFLASRFLDEEEITAGYYKKIIEDLDEWNASSPYFKFGDSILSNTIAYYVDGNKEVATSLKVVLDINDLGGEKIALKKFIHCAHLLFEKAMNQSLPKILEDSLTSCQEIRTEIGNKEISILRNDWPIQKGYSLKFVIRNTN